ncbi:spermatogenesis-associated protein 32 [Peromyscus leucopus]|uniref:spermatogenesis-associated protein 32 n=1 Tax=Peromyscus leucopus TaxID=10041 RepID=UPI0018849F61|nr:spermatogenesis-associated protein 32 [Peromyscus leucopus]
MGVTGVNAFPCCGKNSVDIVERTNDHHQQPHTPKEKEEDETELEAELPKTESLPIVLPDPGPVPQLEEMGPVVDSKPTPEPEEDYFTESLEQKGYRIESLKPYEEERQSRTWSFNANSSNREEEQVSTTQFRSIRVQTSKHLFWANKLIQASEHSLQQALEKHRKSPRERKSVCISQVLTDCAPRPPSPCLSCSSLPTAIGLADLINFASSLAVASSSHKEVPNLENMIKATSEKLQETPIDLCQPVQSIKFTQATQITQITSEKQEKSFEDMTTQKSWTPETSNVACSYLDFSKTGLKNATIQGEVKFVQAPAKSSQLQEANDSVPGTKKGNPLLLKIHFKLSSPLPQKK